MDTPRDGCGRLRRMCHCFRDCANITEREFQKIVELEDAGVALYRSVRAGQDPTQNNGPVYILRTDDDLELKPDEFAMTFAKNKISCPRCIKLIEKAEMLFNKQSHVKQEDIKGVCDHCWKPVAKLKRLAELARKERSVKDSAGVEALNKQMLRAMGTEDMKHKYKEPKQRLTTLKSPRTQIEREPKERAEKEESLKSHETRSSARAEDKARAGQKKEEKSKAKEEKQKGKEEKSKPKEDKTEETKYKSKEKEEKTKFKDKDDKSKDKLEKSKDKEDKVKENEEKQKGTEMKDELKLQKAQMAKENKEAQQRQKQQDHENALAEKKQRDAEKPKESQKNKESTLKLPTLPSSTEDVNKEKIEDKEEKSVDKEDKVQDKEKKHKEPPLKASSGNELKLQMAQIEKENKEAQQRQKQQEQEKALAEKKAKDAEKESLKNKESKSKLKPPTLPTPKEDVDKEKLKEKEVKSEDKEKKEKEPPLGNELIMQMAKIAKEQQAAQMRRKQQEQEKELVEKKAREAERLKQLEEEKNKEPKLEPPKFDIEEEEHDSDEEEIYDFTGVPLPVNKIIIGETLFKHTHTEKKKSEEVQDLGKPVKVQSPKSLKAGKVTNIDSGKTGKVQNTNNTKEDKLNKDIPGQKKEQGQQEAKKYSGDASKTSNLAGKVTNIDSRKTGKVSDNDSGKTGKVQDTNNSKEEKLNKDIPGQKKEQGQLESKKNSGDASKTSKLTSETGTTKSAASEKQKTDTNTYATGDGVIRYALSNRNYIDKGWTLLPVEKIVRKMNVYRMRPAHPEFDWFEHRKNRLLEYDSGQKLAEIDESGRGRWYYRSGKLAMDYYDAEETNAGQRFVVYSTGTPDERGRPRPRTVLATFDYLGNGIVFDHTGKIRLKYNQTEGVVLDRALGPVSHWKWHSLNDPPVLQQVMIDTHMPQRDPKIMSLGPPNADAPREDDDAMLAIEFDNFVKEKTRKSSQTFKPFQIKMKALKINEHFSLRVLDQASVYLQYRDGTTNIKINIGMVLDHKEIIDTDTADIADVSNKMETLPACTNSIRDMQKAVARAKTLEHLRALKELHLHGPGVRTASVDLMLAPASRPLRPPLTCATSHITLTANKPCSCSCSP